jgi:hypothetical protein
MIFLCKSEGKSLKRRRHEFHSFFCQIPNLIGAVVVVVVIATNVVSSHPAQKFHLSKHFLNFTLPFLMEN